ncbi:MAG: hypothetical protein VB934_16095 [Polyangiaceae bacterium]
MTTRWLAMVVLLGVAGVTACSRDDSAAPSAGLSPSEHEAPTVSIAPHEDDGARVLVIASLPGGVANALPQGPIEEKRARPWLRLRRLGASQPMVGRYRRDGKQLEFRPSFALVLGENYRAELRIGARSFFADYQPPAGTTAPKPPRVVMMYPSGSLLPANHLRFYVRFSEPMQTGETFWKHVQLFDDQDAKPLAVAWREINLWSKDRTLVTMLLHPGRVKRGIPFAADLGPVLHQGHSYLLRINAGLLSAAGIALGKAHEKRFRVTAADRKKPHPADWRVDAPAAGSRDAVVMRFGEPMDHLVLTTTVQVWSQLGKRLQGTVAVGPDERSWRFSPAAPWGDGPHRVEVAPTIEDLAGNTPLRLFDSHKDELHAKITPELTLAFTPTKAR